MHWEPYVCLIPGCGLDMHSPRTVSRTVHLHSTVIPARVRTEWLVSVGGCSSMARACCDNTIDRVPTSRLIVCRCRIEFIRSHTHRAKQSHQCLDIDTTKALCTVAAACTCADEWPILPKWHRLRWPIVPLVAVGGYDEYVAWVSRVKVEEQNAHGGDAGGVEGTLARLITSLWLNTCRPFWL